MPKYRAAKGKAKQPRSRGMIPCLIILIGGMALLMLLFYSILPRGS